MGPPQNLQVLPKDITHEQLIRIMREYTADLGVGCTFCHARDPQTNRPNFASDANPHKGIARTMISMTDEINHKYLASLPHDSDADHAAAEVSCGTCHQGHEVPQPFVPPPHTEEHPGGAAPQPPAAK